MTVSLFAALFFTVALLAGTTYFILGSLPLLILKHDTALEFTRLEVNTRAEQGKLVEAVQEALAVATASRRRKG